jgi:DNA modification methylase
VTPYYADDHVALYHGDCREVTDWLGADVLVTDPPYGLGYRQNRAHSDLSLKQRREQRSGATGQVARVGHPTPKPVALMERLIAKCPPGVVADPFAGSGSALLAARANGRQAIGVEIEERYCEIAANRLCQDTLDLTS